MPTKLRTVDSMSAASSEAHRRVSLFDRRPLITTFADKYRVREYVREKLGSERQLIKVYGVYGDPAEIDERDLLDRFVMKPNHGSGLIMFCDRKTECDIDKLRMVARSWMRMNNYDHSKEWCYKHIKPVILIQKWLGLDGQIPPDFHGKPQFVHADLSRFTDHRRNLYDMNWNYVEGRLAYPNSEVLPIKRPKLFAEMREIASKLLGDTDFVRVDLYDGTFTRWNGG